LVTSILLLGFLLVQLFLQVGLYFYLRKVSGSPTAVSADVLPPVSVLVAAHNEEDHLLEYIPLLLAQEYPVFELVLINDRSTDGTLNVMQAFAAHHANIRVVDIRRTALTKGGFEKKNALSMGIKVATHDHLVFTDADCRPADNQWLARFGSAFHAGFTFVIGTGFFERTSAFLNALYRLDSARVAVLYFSAAAAGMPYMAVGRSMGYTRELFFEVKGYLKHLHVPSGDDDLFLQSVAKRARIALVPGALTFSQAPSAAGAWVRQRFRHLAAGKRYAATPLAFLWLYELSLLVTTLGMLVFWYVAETRTLWIGFYTALIARYVIFFFNLKRMEALAGTKAYAAKLFWADSILSMWNALISVAYQLSKSARWRKNT